ncbi:MAG: GGDEF domain-containing protein, partial [Helicobacter sp.]|nr:GGDEF domain-containing protein [Helicobacter sp.]
AQQAFAQKREIVEIVEHLDGFYARIHVPHLGANGDIEGIMSVTVNAIAFRQKYMQIVWWMFVLILAFIVLEILVLRKIFSPYIAFYEDLCENILETDKGNFKKQLHTKLRDEVGDIALLINTTNAKIDAIICNIESRIPSLMHYQKEHYHSNPLVRINEVIDELVDVYQFKRHIEAKSIDAIEQDFIELFERIGLRLLVFVESTNAKDRLIYPADQSILRAYYQSLNLCHLPFETRHEKHVYPITFQNKPALWTMFYITTNVRWECVFDETEERFNTIFPLLSNYFSTSTSTIENRYLLDLLKANSQKDALTGLNNRAFLDEFSHNITSQAQRIELEYAVMMIDIDFFKKVNDNYGHNIGDKVLRHLALVFTQTIRTSDLAVRYG